MTTEQQSGAGTPSPESTRRGLGATVALFVMRNIVKLLVFLVVIIRWPLRRRALSALIILGGIGALVWWQVDRRGSTVDSEAANIVAAPASPSTPEVAVTFFTGLRAFDARGVWDSISPEMKDTYLAAGLTVSRLRNAFDTMKDAGIEWKKVEYLGGYKLSSGNTVYFYIVTIQSRNVQRQLPMPIEVNKSGKIGSDVLSEFFQPSSG